MSWLAGICYPGNMYEVIRGSTFVYVAVTYYTSQVNFGTWFTRAYEARSYTRLLTLRSYVTKNTRLRGHKFVDVWWRSLMRSFNVSGSSSYFIFNCSQTFDDLFMFEGLHIQLVAANVWWSFSVWGSYHLVAAKLRLRSGRIHTWNTPAVFPMEYTSTDGEIWAV